LDIARIARTMHLAISFVPLLRRASRTAQFMNTLALAHSRQWYRSTASSHLGAWHQGARASSPPPRTLFRGTHQCCGTPALAHICASRIKRGRWYGGISE